MKTSQSLRKVLSALLCLALAFSLASGVSAAAQSLSVDSKSAKPGEAVSVAVSLHGNPGIYAFTLDVTYDASKLVYQSHTLGSAFSKTVVNATDGKVSMLWDNEAKDLSGDAAIVTLTFQVKQGASGTASVSAAFTECYNFNEVDVAFASGHGGVAIASGETSAPAKPEKQNTSVPSAGTLQYSDADKIQYKDAVSVLSALGVLEGADGKFRPNAGLKRSESSKIIAYLMCGNQEAMGLLGKGRFTDVPSYHWAAGYVDYCAQQGYINGVGDKRFDPDGDLTVGAFAKLLLCCLGYDAKQEGLVGASWAKNAGILGAKLGLFDGFPGNASLSDVMTREEAALMAYNALSQQVVEYRSGAAQTTGKTLFEIRYPGMSLQ